MKRAAYATFVALGLGVVAARGCSSGSEGTRLAGAPSAVPQETGPDSPSEASALADASLCLMSPTPAAVPAGWVRWSAYDPCCGFYVPASAAVLPPPIQWVQCDGAAAAGLSCRQMSANWIGSTNARFPFGLSVVSWVRPDGAVILGAERDIDLGGGEIGAFVMIAEADGPVHQALLWTLPKRCSALVESIQDEKTVYVVYENNTDIGGGAFGGDISDLYPTSVWRFRDTVAHEYSAGLAGVIDDATMTLYGWAPQLSPVAILRGSVDRGLLDNHVFASGRAIFWSASTLADQEEHVWMPGAGSARLLGFGSDSSQGAGDLGTDGRDLVWLYGSGRAGPAGAFPKVSIMTAPFATDARDVQDRRLRSELSSGFGVVPFKVGCGFAARALASGIRVVRLSDGVSWMLPAGGTLAWQWEEPVAVTCTELFAKVAVSHGGVATTGYARVRLDSLGAGIPPD
jgi:hypothetical protein